MTLCAHTKDADQRNNDTNAFVKILLIRIRFFRACINFAHVCDMSPRERVSYEEKIILLRKKQVLRVSYLEKNFKKLAALKVSKRVPSEPVQNPLEFVWIRVF